MFYHIMFMITALTAYLTGIFYPSLISKNLSVNFKILRNM